MRWTRAIQIFIIPLIHGVRFWLSRIIQVNSYFDTCMNRDNRILSSSGGRPQGGSGIEKKDLGHTSKYGNATSSCGLPSSSCRPSFEVPAQVICTAGGTDNKMHDYVLRYSQSYWYLNSTALNNMPGGPAGSWFQSGILLPEPPW
ncbi:uncharacterized protein LACBIDRAFT_323276 [Laccaria bicolor S238N-H82]|uniref:Predicted protein n=1 Tax=Laccaria bicolor (strain S238N-H82 / ATCC MYA-4686) TaxID=486041 RepID=B0CZP8_LACBS|nr:uncharacterized protein LACBIDRAFT_323276 [Laccaria bicolor S238N-H82]EDR12189.1 predicted protein [Laccaria bicolor S238N-H82]|eukprot:XP_001876453.1 predicted protein [Laccaria bicolor S238N-H82]